MAPNAHLIPDAFVDKLCWAGTPEDVAQQVAAVVDMGIENVTILPHAPAGGMTATTMREFARSVKPRVEALLAG